MRILISLTGLIPTGYLPALVAPPPSNKAAARFISAFGAPLQLGTIVLLRHTTAFIESIFGALISLNARTVSSAHDFL